MFRRIIALMIVTLSLTAGCATYMEQQSNLVQPDEWWSVHPRPVYAGLEKVGTFQEWFDVYKLRDNTYAIYEPNQFEEAMSYLVVGTEKAALIDAGNGIGEIEDVVSSLTKLPVSMILTHEHYDHVVGAYVYDDIAMYDNEDALERLKRGRDNKSLQPYLEPDYFWKPAPKAFDPKSWHIPAMVPSTLLHDGDIIDLGGRTLEVIYTPGHSPGSACLLDKQQRILFTGDHFYPGPLYAYPEDVELDLYIASNEKLCDRLDEFDYLCSGHNDPWVKSEVLPRVSKAFEAVLAGQGTFSESDGLRRYEFDGFGIIIRSDMITKK